MLEHCPKCGHAPLPANQAFPAECPACGVILARAGALERPVLREPVEPADDESLLWHVPDRVDATALKLRAALLVFFAVWGLRLSWLSYRDGDMMTSFIHGPLLVFHEAGHVIFRLFGEWVTVLGGTLGQLLVPAILCSALL